MERRKANSRGPRTMVDGVARITRVALIVTLGILALLAGREAFAAQGSLGGPVVGIVAGHWQNDSGATCPDGLREVDINLAVARRVAWLLEQHGYRVEVLPEYSPRLKGYRAAAFVAIHVDSCVEDLSGFKVVSVADPAVPERQQEFLALLQEAYAAETGLPFHADTITPDMLQYHALQEISPDTPGAIIECGFMGGDRYLLTQEQDRVAAGIAKGLLAFLGDAH